MVSCVLLTNNPSFFALNRQRLTVEQVLGTAWDVNTQARNKIHQGYTLLNHPLYGNFRPYHQPFRSLLLSIPTPNPANILGVDDLSLKLCEEAQSIYASCSDRILDPAQVSEQMFKDCSFIDSELMQATLNTYCAYANPIAN